MDIVKEISLKANYVLTVCNDEVLALIMQETGHDTPERALRDYTGKYRSQLKQRSGHNLVPYTLRYSLASLIAGNTVTPTFKANYIALGTWSTLPANTDTQLDTEVIRRLFGDRRAIDNVAYLDKTFGSLEVWWNTYNEIGVFVDGTASVNTWYLFSRININQTMQALENLTVNVTFTIT